MSEPNDKLNRQRTYFKEPVLSAADLSHPTLSTEYTPLDPQTSIAETKLKDELPQNNRPTTGAVDFIANSRQENPSW